MCVVIDVKADCVIKLSHIGAMERLTADQKANVVKMSDARLKERLARAGYRAELLEVMERPALLQAWAEVVAANAEATARETGQEEETDEVQEEEIDAEVDRARLLLEQKRIDLQERELEEKRLQREFEERKWRREMDQKEREFDWKRQTEERDQAQKDSVAAKLKLWGDALRNTISKMPNEPIEVVSWFICLVRLFAQLNVPVDLKAVLMRPYLNDKAKSLLSRCDISQAADYDAIKQFLLRELRLSASVYLEKFNSVTKDNAETFHQFATRLMSLFDFYVESRKVDSSYERLLELIIYDRIKSTLPQFLARHVLALETSNDRGWLGRAALVEALDAYMANVDNGGRPRLPAARSDDSRPGDRPGGQAPRSTLHGSLPNRSNDRNGPLHGRGTLRTGRRCFNCGSPNHLQSNCDRELNKTGRSTSAVNACTTTVGNSRHDKGRSTQTGEKPRVTHSQPAGRPNQCSSEATAAAAPGNLQPETDTAAMHKVELTSVKSDNAPIDVGNVDDVYIARGRECTVDAALSDGWSQLRFVDINIEGLSHPVSGLNDSGAQICILRADVVAPLALKGAGRATIRGITGDSVECELVSLPMKLVESSCYIPVTCAVCENLVNELILGADVVDRLNAQTTIEQVNVSTVAHNHTDDDGCMNVYNDTVQAVENDIKDDTSVDECGEDVINMSHETVDADDTCMDDDATRTEENERDELRKANADSHT